MNQYGSGVKMATLCELLNDSARKFGDKAALQIKRRYRVDQWSYRRLQETSEQIAAHLASLGIQRGERVLVLAPNMPEWAALYFGCLRAGVIFVPLDVRSSSDFMAKVYQQTDARCLFVSRIVEHQAPDLELPTYFLDDLPEQVSNLPSDSGLPWPAEDDIAEIMFTSGTTGEPKGVMLTHRNIASNVLSANQAVPSRPEYRVLSLLPLSHMLEQTVGLLTPMVGGATVVYASSLQPATIFKTLQEERIATMVVVPQVLGLFWQGIEREVERQGKQKAWNRMLGISAYAPMPVRRLMFRSVHKRLGGNLQFITTGGAYLEPDLARRWELLGIPVLQGYGTTETSPIITASVMQARNHDSVGRVLPQQEIRIAGDGEILTKGPNVTVGYWRNETATKAAFEGDWYMTGDLGEIDAQGFLRLRGRKKDMIVLDNGMNVYPQDIETLFKNHPGVGEAVVLGLPGRGSRVEVHAVLLLNESKADAKSIVASVNERLADHQRVRDFTIWPHEDFPRTHTLKIKKQDVADFLARTRPSRTPR
jgi:long-chain acyl-CoA synthetase